MRNTNHNLLALTLLVFAITPCFAGTITIYSTGAANTGSGQQDPHYQLLTAPNGVSAPIQAYTTTPYSAWLTPPTGVWWDNPFNPLQYGPGGTYDYQTTFDLTGFLPKTAVLSGLTASDDVGTIWLNGVQVASLGSIAALASFTITDGLNGAHFNAGLNMLDFVVDNAPDTPTGLAVQISGTADSSTTPEPSSLLLLGSGVLAIGGLIRRKVCS